MDTNKANGHFEALNPWADADPVPLRGISTRLTDLAGKKVGLFCDHKRTAKPILALVRDKLKARFPTIQFVDFMYRENLEIVGTTDKARFEEWLKGVDAVILAYGD